MVNQLLYQKKKMKENQIQIFDRSIHNQVVYQKGKYNQLTKWNNLIRTIYFVDKNIRNT